MPKTASFAGCYFTGQERVAEQGLKFDQKKLHTGDLFFFNVTVPFLVSQLKLIFL
jgi:hypothetical protein